MEISFGKEREIVDPQVIHGMTGQQFREWIQKKFSLVAGFKLLGSSPASVPLDHTIDVRHVPKKCKVMIIGTKQAVAQDMEMKEVAIVTQQTESERLRARFITEEVKQAIREWREEYIDKRLRKLEGDPRKSWVLRKGINVPFFSTQWNFHH